MDALRQGALKFRYRTYPLYRELFEGLASQQHPKTLFITCADSRIDPNMITDSLPGTLFVDRNPGNFIPEAEVAGSDAQNASEAATLQYAIDVLQVENIVVCGHSDCGAMKALINPKAAESLLFVGKWLENGHTALERAKQTKGWKKLSDEKKLRIVTEQNVVAQLEHIRTYPYVKTRIDKLKINGWVFNIGEGTVSEYDYEQKKFLDIKV